MLYNYSPMLLGGSEFQEFFAPTLFANDTVAKNYVRVLTGIKNKEIVTSIGGDVSIVDYVEDAVLPSGSPSITIGDRYIEPVKKMFLDTLLQEQLRNSRFAATMEAGAANINSIPFQDLVKGYATEKLGEGIEKLYWNQVKAEMTAEADVVKMAGAVPTKANVVSQIEAVYDALPAQLTTKNEATIFADYSAKGAISKLNADNTKYRDTFVANADGSFSYLGMTIKFVPIGAGNMAAGRATDFILGTDLTSDYGSLQIDRVNNYSDKLFIKAVFSLDAAVVIPAEKVLVTKA